MLTNGQFQSKVGWDELVLVVYSVLVGLSLDKSFDFFANSQDKVSSGILLVGIIIVVIENWVYLPLYLKVIDIQSTNEVSLYVSAAIMYSCIPALYLAKTDGTFFTAPEWILVNFSLICLIDALTKLSTLGKMREKYKLSEMSEIEKELAGTYVFYAFTGIFYTILLAALVIMVNLSQMSLLVQSIITTGSWLIIRAIDRIAIPRTTNALAYFYLGKR
ncbi:MAG: hypothetical protein HY867_04350 [Chloroflexi bacterium]|nr:hypothetical protein [Chloroflexota bacterium]